MKYKKIHIIGPAGSGKTTISQLLSNDYNIPHLNLDEIFWDKNTKKFGKKTPPILRDKMLNNFIKQKSYIVEGSYYKWGFSSWENADIIIFLTPPFHITLYRLIKRYFKRVIGIEKSKRGSLIRFLKMIRWNYRWYKRIPEFILNANKYNRNVKQVTNHNEFIKLVLN